MNEALSIDVLQRVRAIFDERFPHAMTAALAARVLAGTGIGLVKVQAAIASLVGMGIITEYGRAPNGHVVYRGKGNQP